MGYVETGKSGPGTQNTEGVNKEQSSGNARMDQPSFVSIMSFGDDNTVITSPCSVG